MDSFRFIHFNSVSFSKVFLIFSISFSKVFLSAFSEAQIVKTATKKSTENGNQKSSRPNHPRRQSNAQNQNVLSENTPLFECNICHKRFLDWANLVKHVSIHVPDTENPASKPRHHASGTIVSSTFYAKVVSKLNHSDASDVHQTVQMNMDSDGESPEVIGENAGIIYYEIGLTVMAYKKSDKSIF